MGVNRLLLALEKEDNLTPEGLRTLYRTLSVKLHPDVTKGSGEDFIRLQEEYAEAMDVIFKSSVIPRESNKKGYTSIQECREVLLRQLYMYAAKFHSQDSEWQWKKLVAASAHYKLEVNEILAAYQKTVLRTYASWRDDAATAYSHNIIIVMIKNLASYFWNRNGPGGRVLRSYPKAIIGRSRMMEGKRAKILIGLAEWIAVESEGMPVDMYPWPEEER